MNEVHLAVPRIDGDQVGSCDPLCVPEARWLSRWFRMTCDPDAVTCPACREEISCPSTS